MPSTYWIPSMCPEMCPEPADWSSALDSGCQVRNTWREQDQNPEYSRNDSDQCCRYFWTHEYSLKTPFKSMWVSGAKGNPPRVAKSDCFLLVAAACTSSNAPKTSGSAGWKGKASRLQWYLSWSAWRTAES